VAAVKDRSWQVRRAAAGNERATEAVLRIAALDPDPRVGAAVAGNPKATLATRVMGGL
jgi:hypothetical protein